ncbi:NADPH-dependent FMN reductase [Plantactinospora sonchi]|uniref:NAD(P)H-dependent oxidoreductase n=1 Tax=Plantactinospora sonchi TaxID=1544735 RepID=A0ABU7RQY1_9ACTN
MTEALTEAGDTGSAAPPSSSGTARNPERELNLLVVIASVRQGRFGPVVARWFEDEARRHGRFRIDVLDLAETPLPADLPAGPAWEWPAQRSASQRELADRLAGADAVVVVTPEYNHSFPASIKHLVDWHFTEWQAKPVGFVSYGGVSGGLRAVEQLRLVFAEMHAVTIRDTVSFDRFWERFGADGRPADADGSGTAVKAMLDQLGWWAGVLAEARRRSPYQDGN